ncbi:MAG: sulfatase/phosphatase domain-containing protein, partial [Rubripirellula sp.]
MAFCWQNFRTLKPHRRCSSSTKRQNSSFSADRFDLAIIRLPVKFEETKSSNLLHQARCTSQCAHEQRNQQTNNSYGEAWANASNTPFRLYKHFAHEGGTSTPFFMHWPDMIQPRQDWFRSPAQLIDIVPTLLDVAGATHPEQFNENAIPALDGISLRRAFTGERLDRSEPICVE